MTRLPFALAVSVAMAAHGAQQNPGERDLLTLSAATASDSLPPLWQRRAVRGSTSPTSAIREDGSGRFLSINGERQAAWFALDLRRQPLARGGTAHLEYRLPVVPAGSDLTVRDQSDAALRLYFVLESPRRLLPGTRLVMYSMGTVNSGVRVQRTNTVCDIRVPQSRTLTWQSFVVSPANDAARDCGWNEGRILAVGMMQDTDQTGAPAEAHIRAFVWRE
ncbi:DUF3047 domain-containing protein [Gemmatimonas phototrophica]|nr:DUF3047 domain-containing protein [Gemmatimonas phototrophica]